MSSEENSPPNSPQKKAQPKSAPMRSQQLDRTLHELESAFLDWEQLNATTQAILGTPAPVTLGTPSSEEEFRVKTKKLLSQLREQLAELNDEPVA